MTRIYATNLYRGQHMETLVMLLSEIDYNIICNTAEQVRPFLNSSTLIRSISFTTEPSAITVGTFVLDLEEHNIDDNLYDSIQRLADGYDSTPLYLPVGYENRVLSWFSYTRQVVCPYVDHFGIWVRMGHNPSSDFLIKQWDDGG